MCVVYFVNILQTRLSKLAYLIIYRADFGENFLLITKKIMFAIFIKKSLTLAMKVTKKGISLTTSKKTLF